MKARTISGAIVLAIFALITYFGSIPFLIMSLIIGLGSLFEIYRVMGIEKKPYTILSYLAIIAIYVIGYFNNVTFIAPIIFVIVYLIIIVIRFDHITLHKNAIAFIAIFYVGGFSYCMYRLRMMDDGIYNICLVFASSWCSDIGAYLIGSVAGKHHPFPNLSAKKSIEGCIGGLFSSVLFGIITALIFKRAVINATIICLIGSVFSQVGDLAASAIKRKFRAKDYGKLIPGHGGLLDRFDSMLFVSAVFYVLLNIL